jgi:hypothetical protein
MGEMPHRLWGVTAAQAGKRTLKLAANTSGMSGGAGNKRQFKVRGKSLRPDGDLWAAME